MKCVTHIISGMIMCLGACMVMMTERSETTTLLLSFSAMFLMYILVLSEQDTGSKLVFWIAIALLLRVITIFFFPNLSDDIYRYIWDGSLSVQGENPYLIIPGNLVSRYAHDIYPFSELFEKLNSPEYHTVYPPFCQLLFWSGAWFLPEGWFAQSVFLKLTLLIAETGSIFLLLRILKKLGKPLKWVLVYALNPLVILEVVGNIHFEGWMIFFMLASYLAFLNSRHLTGSILLGLGVLTKLIPLIVAPFLVKRIRRQKLAASLVAGFSIVLLAFLPFLEWEMVNGLGSSLGLYFQKFEFNASIYYLLRGIIGPIIGYNPIGFIGPALGLIFTGSILWFSCREKIPNWPSLPAILVIALTVYYLLSTTVHPWYLSTIIAFAALTPIRYPVYWSFLIFSTYMAYSFPVYQENPWIIAIEYTTLGILIILEFREHRSELSQIYLE